MKTLPYLILILSLYGCIGRNNCELSTQKFDLNLAYEESLDFSFCNINPNYFQLHFSGELEGDILLLEYYKFSGNGKIDTLITADYYANEFIFNYRPLGKVKGDLEFKISLL
ncbi:hypothetical protein [Algoriphagus yeomjeoni]|uniref:Lipoprotein n=1 Tax=Algoriphagus yeomjeoni TaxID=291403 RepID=A0A327PSA6_9BACT|nr:hypothetical protein [Algoriphagus yeomjeoni]RAI95200.1 hypothetical protein LV83_00451 [Algoriphagus yeomjeoni]